MISTRVLNLSSKLRRVSVAFALFAAISCSAGFAGVATAQASGQAADQVAPEQTKAQPSPSAASGPQHTVQKKEEKSEAEQINEYRHSASVQWFARAMHVDVETAAKLFEYINFAVILLALGIPLLRMLPKAMKQRSAKLSVDLEQAKAETMDAQERLRAVEAKLSGLDSEIAAIRKQVEDEMRQDESRIKSSIGEESARIVASAEHEIQVAATQAQRSLKQFVADLVIDRAVSQLHLDEETDRAMIAEFASDTAASGGRGKHKVGQN